MSLAFAIAVLVVAGSPGPAADTVLTAADREFLIAQCQVRQEDVDVIPKLDTMGRKAVAAAVVARNCRGVASLKVSRDYYRTLLALKPGTALPPAPAGLDWTMWTDEEFLTYVSILKAAEPALPQNVTEQASSDPSCGVPEQDIKVVPQLGKEVQAKILRWMSGHDCKRLQPLIRTRDYFRKLLQLKPGQGLPLPPAGWDYDYLTEEEFGQYTKILDRH